MTHRSPETDMKTTPDETTRDPFGLGHLPPPDPPGDPWPDIAAGLERDRRRAHRIRLTGWAAAATIVLAVGVISLLPERITPETAPAPAAAQVAGIVDPAIGPESAGPDAPQAGADSLHSLIALSQRLESRLRRVRAQAGDLPARSLVYQVELEDLVAQVDEALSRHPGSHRLWSQRVNLLLDLNQIYSGEVRREQGLYASL